MGTSLPKLASVMDSPTLAYSSPRTRAATADAETLSSLRKRKHSFGDPTADSDDEEDEDEADLRKRGESGKWSDGAWA